MMGHYCVIEFIQPPNENIERHVIVPNSWIVRKLESMQPGTVIVAYPKDDPEIIALRVKKKREYKKSWTHYVAIAKYLAQCFDQAESWIEIYNEHMQERLKLASAKGNSKKPPNTLQCKSIKKQSTEVIERTTQQCRDLRESPTASCIDKPQIKFHKTDSTEVAAKRKLPMDSKDIDVKRSRMDGSTPKNHIPQPPEQQVTEDSRDVVFKDCSEREAAESSMEKTIRHRASAIECSRLLFKRPQGNERESTSSSNDDHLQQAHARQEEQDKIINAISNINHENKISMDMLFASIKTKILTSQSDCVHESHHVSRSNNEMLKGSVKEGYNQKKPTQCITKTSPAATQTVSRVDDQLFLVSEKSNDEPHRKTLIIEDELYLSHTTRENVDIDSTYQEPPSQSITNIDRQLQPQNTLRTTTQRNLLEQNHSYQTPFVQQLPNVYRQTSQLSSNKNINPPYNNHTPYHEDGPLTQNMYAGGSIIADHNNRKPHNQEYPKNMSPAGHNFQTEARQLERFDEDYSRQPLVPTPGPCSVVLQEPRLSENIFGKPTDQNYNKYCHYQAPSNQNHSKGNFVGRSNGITHSISPKMIEDRLSAAQDTLRNEDIENYSFDDIKQERFSPISVHSSDQDMSSDELYIDVNYDENNYTQNTQIEEQQFLFNTVHACFENTNISPVATNDIRHDTCVEFDESLQTIMEEIIKAIPSASEDTTEIRENNAIKTETIEFSRDNDDFDVYEAPNRERIRNKRSLVFPPVFNTNDDDRWTLKHPNAGPGVVELMKHSGVYIDATSLFYCKSMAEDCKKLARMLLTEIFTLNALMICSISGARIHFKSTTDDSCYMRPGLHKHAMMALVTFVIKYGTRKRWSYCNATSILESLRYRIKYIRKKFGNIKCRS